MKQVDVLFVNPNGAPIIYQDLAKDLSAIEPPIWAALLANAVRQKGFKVELLDCEAERINDDVSVHKIQEIKPRLIVFVAYGQQPSASTQNMSGVNRLITKMKTMGVLTPIAIMGAHASACPRQVMENESCDFVIQGEGLYTIVGLLSVKDLGRRVWNEPNEFEKIPGLWYKYISREWKIEIAFTKPAQLIPQEKLHIELPGMAWDLLDIKKYRTSNWHAMSNGDKREPFASIYTSLGCPFACGFCLDENTKIILSKQKNKQLKDVLVGDMVLSWDENKNEITETEVIALSERKVDEILEICLEDGKKILATKEHPFYIDGKWIDAGDLKEGDNVLVIEPNDKLSFRMKNNNPMKNEVSKNRMIETWKQRYEAGEIIPFACTEKGKIVAINVLQGERIVRNIECFPYNNYFAENILTHNCMINAPFGNNNLENGFGKPSFRYWSPEHTIKELDKIASFGITNLKIADEMFVLYKDHYAKLCELIVERGHKFNIWAYSRINTVDEGKLDLLKQAGVNWLALGIEAGSAKVRKDVIKGSFKDVAIVETVKKIQNAGINVIGNFIFGLPEDDLETMNETLQLALDLKCEFANFYSAMSYPGSKLFLEHHNNPELLPESYSGYSQHSYDCTPLNTKHISNAAVLKFRDEAFKAYYSNKEYLDFVERKFGINTRKGLEKMNEIKLRRKLLGDK